jgi:hypothetical protein
VLSRAYNSTVYYQALLSSEVKVRAFKSASFSKLPKLWTLAATFNVNVNILNSKHQDHVKSVNDFTLQGHFEQKYINKKSRNLDSSCLDVFFQLQSLPSLPDLFNC